MTLLLGTAVLFFATAFLASDPIPLLGWLCRFPSSLKALLMRHFFQDIHGWFDFDDIYRAMVSLAPKDRVSHFVELGSWVGRSAAYLGVEIVNSGKPIRLDCVDSWEGTGAPGEYDEYDQVVKQCGLYESFLANMKPLEGRYCAQRGMTTEIAARYEDSSLDFVFFDAGHVYDAISADLEAWLPKVKPEGWIAGHDYFSAPEGVGRAVRERVKNFGTIRASWIARADGGDLSALASAL